ncbi:hypothetical protein EST38_g12579 [Candolleomyces aberdarensis]|uniref:Uncharacterized protein n=1 Tax=Candolleomyces aberdarensis TaxID=2316362 RepID=A0A4Q2D541_9AGAR|nr:hypothetical protein EST38_g12579 [Candolleomyces aberdarensis]
MSSSSLKNHVAGAAVNYCSIDGHGSSGSSSIDTQLERPQSRWAALKESFASEVDGQRVTPPLLGYLFMAGYIDVISFSAIFVWCGFQTGNFAQLGLAIARLWEGGVQIFRITDQQALCSHIALLP